MPSRAREVDSSIRATQEVSHWMNPSRSKAPGQSAVPGESLRADRGHPDHVSSPAFAQFKHVGRPNIPNRERLFHRFNDILDRAWLTNNGSYVREFEARVADIAGTANCVAVSNGTMALNVAGQAMHLSGEIIMPALTFVATPHAFSWQGMQPVFADVDPATCCVDPDHVESLITPRTSAIVGVHLWGQICDVDRLAAIANRHGLKLLFDASHAFGCHNQDRAVGGFGDAETFSFHATKFVSSIEGGAIVTNDDQLAERMRRARNFGFSGVDQVSQLGINAKLNELCAAFGITSLESLPALTECNRQNHQHYADGLRNVPGIHLVTGFSKHQHNRQYIVIRVDPSRAGITRDDLMERLHQQNIGARRYFFPGCHKCEPYAAKPVSLPITDMIVDGVLTLPTGSTVSTDHVRTICDIIRDLTRPHLKAS